MYKLFIVFFISALRANSQFSQEETELLAQLNFSAIIPTDLIATRSVVLYQNTFTKLEFEEKHYDNCWSCPFCRSIGLILCVFCHRISSCQRLRVVRSRADGCAGGQVALEIHLRGLRGRDRFAGRAFTGALVEGGDGADLPAETRPVSSTGRNQAFVQLPGLGRHV